MAHDGRSQGVVDGEVEVVEIEDFIFETAQVELAALVVFHEVSAHFSHGVGDVADVIRDGDAGIFHDVRQGME